MPLSLAAATPREIFSPLSSPAHPIQPCSQVPSVAPKRPCHQLASAPTSCTWTLVEPASTPGRAGGRAGKQGRHAGQVGRQEGQGGWSGRAKKAGTGAAEQRRPLAAWAAAAPPWACLVWQVIEAGDAAEAAAGSGGVAVHTINAALTLELLQLGNVFGELRVLHSLLRPLGGRGSLLLLLGRRPLRCQLSVLLRNLLLLLLLRLVLWRLLLLPQLRLWPCLWLLLISPQLRADAATASAAAAGRTEATAGLQPPSSGLRLLQATIQLLLQSNQCQPRQCGTAAGWAGRGQPGQQSPRQERHGCTD